jgi:hypothetical protein
VVQTYNPRTGESRDYASLADLCDTSDTQGTSVQADTCRRLPQGSGTDALLWIECPLCGADVPFRSPEPCACGWSE